MNRNIYALILIILAIGIYFTVTQSILDQSKLVQASNVEYDTAIKNAKRLIEVRDKVITDYNQLSSDDRSRLDKIIPNSVDNIRLIIDMNNIALNHGFSLRGINVSVDNTKGASTDSFTEDNFFDDSIISTPVLDQLSISFSLNAPYQQFISFMQDLEANLRIMDVTSLSVTSNDNGIYDWKVTLKTYWLRNP